MYAKLMLTFTINKNPSHVSINLPLTYLDPIWVINHPFFEVARVVRTPPNQKNVKRGAGIPMTGSSYPIAGGFL